MSRDERKTGVKDILKVGLHGSWHIIYIINNWLCILYTKCSPQSKGNPNNKAVTGNYQVWDCGQMLASRLLPTSNLLHQRMFTTHNTSVKITKISSALCGPLLNVEFICLRGPLYPQLCVQRPASQRVLSMRVDLQESKLFFT